VSETRTNTAAIAASIGVGLGAWLATAAHAPRYSSNGEHTAALRAYVAILVAAALIGGWIAPRSAGVIGGALGLPGLILSPWTAPRGDGDGLWILIIPMLFSLCFVLILIAGAAAHFGARVRRAPPSRIPSEQPPRDRDDEQA
jgi:hypothetical protein